MKKIYKKLNELPWERDGLEALNENEKVSIGGGSIFQTVGHAFSSLGSAIMTESTNLRSTWAPKPGDHTQMLTGTLQGMGAAFGTAATMVGGDLLVGKIFARLGRSGIGALVNEISGPNGMMHGEDLRLAKMFYNEEKGGSISFEEPTNRTRTASELRDLYNAL